MEEQNPIYGFLPAGGRPARNPEVTQSLDYYPNEYDKGYREGINQGWNRSANQSGMQQLGYGLVSRTASIIPKLGAGLGSVLGAAWAIGPGELSDVWDNPINNWFNSLDEGLKEALPVYSSQANDMSGLLGKMATTSFWASDAFDGLAYAASAFIPGALIGKAASATGAAMKASDVGRTLLKGLDAVGATAHRTSLTMSTAYNTISEAGAEAFQTQKELELLYLEQGMKPIDAKAKAAESAARVFNGNLAVLAVPNLIQNTFFHGSWNKLQGKVREAVNKTGDLTAVKELSESWAKAAGVSVVSEGFWEENIQTTIQQWERNAALSGNIGDKRTEEIAVNFVNNIGSFFNSFVPGKEQSSEEIEAATSIFLGSMIGGLAATRGHFRDKASLKELGASELERYNYVGGDGSKAAIGIMAENVKSFLKSKGKKMVKTDNGEVEITDFVLDDQGNTQADDEAINRFVTNQLRDKSLWDAHMVALYRNDPALGELNKQMALGTYVFNLMNTSKYQYTAEEISNHLDRMTEIGTEEAKQLGVDTYIKENLDVAKQFAKELEAIQSKYSSIAKDVKSDPKDAAFNEFATKNEFYLGIKKKALENILPQATTEKGRESVLNLIEDTDKYISYLKNNRSEARKEFESTVIDRLAKKGERSITTDSKKKDQLEYEIAVDEYANGTWDSVIGSRTLPSTEARELVKVKPGEKDMYQYGVGKSLITADRIGKALANNEDIVDIAAQFVDNVKVVPQGSDDLILTQQQEIISKLDDETKRVKVEYDVIGRVLEAQGDNSIEYGLTARDSLGQAFQMDDEGVKVLLDEMNLKGSKFTLDTPIEEILESTQYAEFLQNYLEKFQTAGAQLSQIAKLKRKVKAIDFKNSKLEAYQKAIDKDEFLEKQFYEEEIKRGAEAFELLWRQDPEGMIDDSSWNGHHRRLTQASIGSKIQEIIDDANKRLDIFSEIWQTILTNANNNVKIHNTINKEIVESIVEALPIEAIATAINKPELISFIDKIQTQDDVASFDAVISLLGEVKGSKSETLEQTKDSINDYLNKKVKEFIERLRPKYPELGKLFDAYARSDRKDLQEKIYLPTQALLAKHFTTKYGSNVPAEYTRFTADLDMFLLHASISKSRIADTEDKQLVQEIFDMYFDAIGTNIALGVLESDLNVAKLEEFKANMQVIPSLQQNIALTQAITFLNSKPKSFDSFSGWLLVRGIAGSGKTHFLGNQLKALSDELLGRQSKVLAFSKEDATSKNINEAIFGGNAVKTNYDVFNNMPEDVLAQYDFLVIDEIFTFTDQEVNNIRTLAAKAKVKVIALGDASQLTAEKEPAPLGALSINMTIPLTTSYRTNVSAIASFINNYRLNSKLVDSNIASSNVSIEELVSDPTKAYGVISVTPEQLDVALHTPTSRSRVLIVPTQQAKVNLQSRYPTLEIRTPDNAQGLQWDEVYSTIEYESDITPFENNRTIYTAYSRAKSLLVIVDPLVNNAIPTPTLEQQVKNSDIELNNIREMFHINMKGVDDLRDLLNGISAFSTEDTTKEEMVYTYEPASDASISNAMGVDDVIDLPDPITTPSGQTFANPRNFGLVNWGIEGDQRLARGSKLHFIKTKNSANEISIYVVGENQHAKKDRLYFEVAKISEEDYNTSAKAFLNEVSKSDVFVVDEALVKAKGDFHIPDINRVSAGSVTVTDYLKFKTLYGTTYYSDKSGLIPGAKDIIEDALIKAWLFYKDLSKPIDKPWITLNNGVYTVNWKNVPDSAVTMLIPTKHNTKAADGFGWNEQDHIRGQFSVAYGVPYLAIRFESGNAKPQLIRFQPKKLNKNHKYVSVLKDLQQAVSTVERLTTLQLGTEEFKKLIIDYKDANFTAEPGKDKKGVLVLSPNAQPISNVPQSVELEDAVQNIIRLVFAPKNEPKYFRVEENAKKWLEENGTPIENSEDKLLNGKRIVSISQAADGTWVYNYSTDPTDVTATKVYTIWKVSEGLGPAQVALNSLAQANNRIGSYQFRETIISRRKADVIKLIRSPSILLSDNYRDYAGFYKDPTTAQYLTQEQIDDFAAKSDDIKNNPKLGFRLQDALVKGILEKEKDYTHAQAVKLALEMTDAYNTVPITSFLLDKIVGDSAFDASGEHTQLRTPLQLTNIITKKGVNDLGKDLKGEQGTQGASNRAILSGDIRHNFEGFQRTQIFYDHPSIGVIELPQPPQPKVFTIQELIAKLKPTGVKTYDDIIALLKKLQINASVVSLPNGIPYTDAKGVTTERSAASTVITDGVATIYSHNFDFGNLEKASNEKLQVFLHEALHVASKQALEKGISDSRKKLDTKEALLYRRIQAIKRRFDGAVKSKRNPATGLRFKTSEVYQETISKLDVREFIASLSNPEFVELAKSISLIPQGNKKSMLREMLEAIVYFFKSILGGNPSVYDAAIASLEEFYSTREIVEALPISIAPEVIYKPEELISDLTKEINKQSEFTFNNTISAIKAKWSAVIDINSLPSEYGDDFTIELSDIFSKLLPLEQSLLLTQSKSSNAWYDVTKDKLSYSTGSIGTTIDLGFNVTKLLEAQNFIPRQRFLIESIIRLEALGVKNLDLIKVVNSPEEFIDLLFNNNIFSNKDKEQFRLDLNTKTDTQTIDALKAPETGVLEFFNQILTFVNDNNSLIKTLIIRSRNASTNRYRIAKQYVERLIKANLDLDSATNPTKLIKTISALRAEIEQLVKQDNPVLPSGLTLIESVDKLEKLYAKVKDYSKLTDPYQKNKLLFIDIPQLENEISAIKSLSLKDVNTNTTILDLILKDIYPNSDFSEVVDWKEELYRLAEEEYLSRTETETEDLELSGIAEHVKKYDQSYEMTLSESMKNSFRRITLDDRVISPALAYIKTMQLMMSLDWNIHTVGDVKGRELGLPYIRKQLQKLLDDGVTSNLNKAIINNVIKIINDGYHTNFFDVSLEFGDRALGIIQIKGDDNTIWYAAYSADVKIPNAHTLTYKEIEYQQSQGNDVKLSPSSKNTTELSDWLLGQKYHTVKQFNRLFTKGDSLNTARAIHNTMASMKETFLYTANRSNNKGIQLRFQRGIASGVTGTIKTQIKANLINFYEEGELPTLRARFNALEQNGVRMDKLKDITGKKIDYIKNFFNFLGVDAPDLELQGAGISDTINKIEGFLERTMAVEEYTLADDLGDDINKAYDIYDWLDYDEGVDGYISKFSEILTNSDKLVRNQSVRDANGKKYYVNHETSHFYKTLNNLIEIDSNSNIFKGGTGKDKNRIIPDFLKSIPTGEKDEQGKDIFLESYYDHNIFVRGSIFNKLYQVIEIDGSRNIVNNSVTDYTRENMFYFFQRNFNQQFIDGIRQNKNTYFQSTFTPSDSPKALAVKIGIISDEELDNGKSPILSAIEQMFEQVLPRVGLSGAKFSNFDNSIKNDLFRNFKLGAKALQDSELPLTKENIPQLARFVYDQLSIEASNLLNELTSADVKLSLDINTFLVAQKLLAHKSGSRDIPSKLNTKQFPQVKTGYGTAKKHTRASTNSKGEYIVGKEETKNLLLPIFDLWFKNDYVNSFFLNQLVTGDYAAYKNSGGIIKRYGSIKGPQVSPLIDPVIGMKSHRNVLILGDRLETYDEAVAFFTNLLYGDNVPELTPELDIIVASLDKNGFTPTDGQGYMTDKWLSELSRGFESSWGLGTVAKPLHMNVEREIIGDYVTGKPILDKYSSINLNKSFTDIFPRMARFKRALEILDIDEAIHDSVAKLGNPKTIDENGNSVNLPTIEDLLSYTDEQLLNMKNNWKVSPILRQSNAGYGLQFNAATDPNKKVSLFTQLMYFLNTYPDELAAGTHATTQEAAKEVYDLIGELIATGREEFLQKIGNTKESLVTYLKKNLRGPGSERALALLEAGVSIDNPLIEKKAIISLTSGLEKATIKVNFKGGKLVLQSAEGISKRDIGTATHNVQELSYRKEILPNGASIIVAEVIVPKEMLTKEQLSAISWGKSIHLMPDMLGFRLPSTEFHSALVMRVVGVYSAKKSNVIIVPKHIVPISGADYDVDSLFVITQELFSNSETTLMDGIQLNAFAGVLKDLIHRLRLSYQDVSLSTTYRNKIKKLIGEVQTISGLATDEQDDVPAGIEDRINGLLDKFKHLPDDVTSILSDVINHLVTFKKIVESQTVIGEVDAPVGYNKVDGKYVIDTSFLQKINDALSSLEGISGDKELMPSLDKIKKAEIKKVKALKEKYIKNRIIDIMMTVVADSKNASRTFSAISFDPLKDAIAKIPEELITSNENLDLSHAKDQFLAYLSVSSGQTLIGSFANASKWFGYITRAGGGKVSDRIFQMRGLAKVDIKLLKASQDITESIADMPTIIEMSDTSLSELDRLRKLDKVLEKYVRENIEDVYKYVDQSPILNPNQAFSIRENGVIKVYDRLVDIDSDGVYRTTQSFSTLTNASIDDLNQGFLSRAKINTNTGSTIIGLTALGVPFRIAIKFLYQPILSSLTGGKLNNLDRWIEDLQKEYGVALDLAADDVLSVENDLDIFLHPNKHHLHKMERTAMFEALSPEEKLSQLRVLALFIKANKIGQDGRNLATFLNVIRQWDVFIEDIENVEDNLEDKIGTMIELPSGELALQTRSDFSFNIPNLLEGSRHIKEAYLSHRTLREIIHGRFLIHSEEITGIATKINSKLKLKHKDKKNVTLNSIRQTLKYYIASGLVSENLPKSEIIKYKDVKLVSSGVNVFLNKTARKLKAIKDFARSSGDQNLFLENVIITFDKYATAKIQFKTGVGLNPEDQKDLVTGFENINQYDIVDGKVIKIIPDSPNFISSFQNDLMRYAVLTTGLQYGGSGFSSYITPELIESIDKNTNDNIRQLIREPHTEGFEDHFVISYTLLNATKLAYFTKEDLIPTSTSEEGKNTYAGIDVIEGNNVYFDLKAKREKNSKGEFINLPLYVRMDWGKKVKAFKLVFITDDVGYYQLMGRADQVIIKPVSQDSDFNLEVQFNPNEAFIAYHHIDGNKILSYSSLLSSLKVGDIVYIYPSYSYDRTEKQRVKILGKAQGEGIGTQVNFEVIDEAKILPQVPVLSLDQVLTDNNQNLLEFIADILDNIEEYKWARYATNGYEVSSAGDSRFSALFAKFKDGRFIEDVYQLDIKGKGTAQPKPNDTRTYITKQGKGLLYSYEEQYEKYKDLWRQWIAENPDLFNELKELAKGKTLTDKFASTPVSQARALAEILNEDQIGEALKEKCK